MQLKRKSSAQFMRLFFGKRPHVIKLLWKVSFREDTNRGEGHKSQPPGREFIIPTNNT